MACPSAGRIALIAVGGSLLVALALAVVFWWLGQQHRPAPAPSVSFPSLEPATTAPATAGEPFRISASP